MEAASSQLSAPALDAEQLEDFAAVFSLLDDQRTGVISEALLSQALNGTGLAASAEEAARHAEGAAPRDLDVFRARVVELVQAATRQAFEVSGTKAGSKGAAAALPTTGTALLCVPLPEHCQPQSLA